MKTDKKTQARKARQRRVRSRVSGTAARPRVSIFRSNTALKAQLIDDVAAVTLASVSTMTATGKTMADKAVAAGTELAKLAKAKKVTEVVFDRGGYKYTGNIKAFADSLREAGMQF